MAQKPETTRNETCTCARPLLRERGERKGVAFVECACCRRPIGLRPAARLRAA
jgi:hypothetical protein